MLRRRLVFESCFITSSLPVRLFLASSSSIACARAMHTTRHIARKRRVVVRCFPVAMYHHNIITTHDIVSRLSIMAYEQTIHTLRVFNNTDAEHRSPSDVARMDILDCDGSAFILRDFFSLEECQSYIEQAEAFGMKSCGYKHSIRITDRVAAKSQLVANQLFQRLVPFCWNQISILRHPSMSGQQAFVGHFLDENGIPWA